MADDAARRSSLVRDQLFEQTVCKLIMPVRGISILGDRFSSTLSIGDHVLVKVEENRHAKGGFALSVHRSPSAEVVGRIGRQVAERLVPFIRLRGFQLVEW